MPSCYPFCRSFPASLKNGSATILRRWPTHWSPYQVSGSILFASATSFQHFLGATTFFCSAPPLHLAPYWVKSRGMNRDFEVGNYFWLWIFGLAFGLTEAAVVVYLRQIFNDGSAILFPVKFSLLGTQSLIIGVEIQRELASVVLLAVFSIFFSPRFFFRFLGFTVLFGVWDLSYYLFLKLQLGWPPSLFTYDILFLFPTLWVAPVFCPMLVSATMIFFSSTVLFHAKRRVVRGPTLVHWSLVLTGGLAVLYSMMGNAAYFQNGGLPPRFGWDFFVGGYGLAVLAASHYLLTVMQSRTRF